MWTLVVLQLESLLCEPDARSIAKDSLDSGPDVLRSQTRFPVAFFVSYYIAFCGIRRFCARNFCSNGTIYLIYHSGVPVVSRFVSLKCLVG